MITNAKTERFRLAHVLTCVGLGALSGFIAGIANTVYAGQAVPLYFIRPSLFIIFVVSVVAPFVEEQIKPLGLYFLKEEEKVSLSLGNWAILGTFAGLGFGLLENSLYAFQTFAYGAHAALTLLGLRTLVCIPIHMIATTITGFGIGLWAKTNKARYFLQFLIIAMLIHGFYNLAVTMAG